MTTADRVIRWTTAGAVVGVAAVAAVASYEHAYALVRAHGEAGLTGRLLPLTVDGLISASSMVMLDSARRKVPVPPLARCLLGLGIARRLLRSSRVRWRPGECPRCGRSAPGCTSGRHVRSGSANTWQRLPTRRKGQLRINPATTAART
ncbi:DUF2637 domain-containing protein [Trebonia kvetii]|uniref:DUF2637 domain-containing protein n=1 Tax=Trebonia kvetii TaxID=2480626 RepID=A0A6P2BXM3_9ACTN|nr:DUF2637 domain-containing protein [Trebonia kvetii]